MGVLTVMEQTLRIATALIAIGTVLPAAGAEGATANCKARALEKVVARSKAAVVLRGHEPRGHVYLGCLRSTGRRRVLFREFTELEHRVTAHRLTLAGRFAAVELDSDVKNDVTKYAAAFDIRSGRSGDVLAGTDYRGTGAQDSYAIERLVVSRRGAVAWRATHVWREPELGTTSQEVVLADSHGRRVLDSAAPDALGGPAFVSASKVAWSRDGADDRAARAYAGLPRD